MNYSIYGDEIQNDSEFCEIREINRITLGKDIELRRAALHVQMKAEKHKFGYQHQWGGVPVIRLPEDIVLLQEIIWEVRPDFIIETGIARGGSLVLSASLMNLAGLRPNVFGIDIQILDHAKKAIIHSAYKDQIIIWEGDSKSELARKKVMEFIKTSSSQRKLTSNGDFNDKSKNRDLHENKNLGLGILILDSDHTQNHVLAELQNFCDLLLPGSIILVADTIIEEYPENHYAGRPWGKSNNPKTAIDEFIKNYPNYGMSEKWARRCLLTEFRDGILRRNY
jgi:cephalosporin hydroxylase